MCNAIKFKNIYKDFNGNQVLKNINFEIGVGEIHALLGENGAGKSTLLNILQGVYQEYDGEVHIGGKRVQFNNTQEAIETGISKVHQEINLVSELTVGQNITLGYEPRKFGIINYKEMYQKTDEILKKLGCNFDSSQKINSLSVGEMQMILIAKALYHNAKIISFDEPTASLSDVEADRLLELIKELKENGITIIYISHRLDEVLKIADKSTILRDGKHIGTFPMEKMTKKDLIKYMIGRDLSNLKTRKKSSFSDREKVLEIKNLKKENVFDNINFSLNKGEILGFAGLVGSKRTDVMRSIFGADDFDSGEIYINGKKVLIKNPIDAVKNGIGLIPEERKTQGFVKYRTNFENIALSSMDKVSKGFVINKELMIKNSKKMHDTININPKNSFYLTESLSGGNQQKVVLSKWLLTDAEILIFDEPTKGVDIGAKEEIYGVINSLVEKGLSVIIISSELPEIISLCDRVIVMKEGRIKGELNHINLTEEKIMYLAMGGE
ncbi:sugar ABC transporter ATP-binding protein [Cetobacterium sp.]|uniref:sugar ABC transporter ATP-binding protein n=1 Tax=Cetobacterium sp. TaxID=2071632 RepID=UPI003F30DDB6